MKCLCCGMDFSVDLGKCPRCKFPVIGLTDDSEESRKQLLKMAADYRKKHWHECKVFLEVYSNKIKNYEVVTEAKEYILLGETSKMPSGGIRWNAEKFARLNGDCKLNVAIECEGTDRKLIKLSVANPKINDFWQVGLKKKTDDAYCIVVGNEAKYTESAEFDVY